MPQLRATVETFCCSQSSRSLFSTRATNALGCLPLESCSTPSTCTGKRGPAMSPSSSSRSRITAPCTSPAKHSVTWKFSAGTQRASGTPDCSVVSPSAISSGTGRAMNSRGIVEVLDHEGQEAVCDGLRAMRIGMDAIGLDEGGALLQAVEDERIEGHPIFFGDALV